MPLGRMSPSEALAQNFINKTMGEWVKEEGRVKRLKASESVIWRCTGRPTRQRNF